MMLIIAIAILTSVEVFAREDGVDKSGNQYITQQDLDILVNNVTQKILVAEAMKDSNQVVALFRIRNKTTDHLDTKAILNQIGNKLVISKKVRVVDRDALDEIAKEQAISESLSKKRDAIAVGEIARADFLIHGELAEISKDQTLDKFIYLNLVIKLTDVSTSEDVFSTEAEVKKKMRKELNKTGIFGKKY